MSCTAIAHPDDAKRIRVGSLPFTVAETHGVVLGLSRLGLARFAEPGVVEALRGVSNQHVRDALIAATAHARSAVYVTYDNRARNAARRVGLDVWSPGRLVAYLWALAC